MTKLKNSSAKKKSTVGDKVEAKKKKGTKRSQSEYPSLEPHLNLRSRQDLIDYDYIDKLSPSEKEWLDKFTSEYTNGSLDRKSPRKNLHKSKRLIKDCYDRNNARNRCILTQQKAMGMINNLEDIKEVTRNPEAELNLKMDLQTQGYMNKDGEIKSDLFVVKKKKSTS